MVDWSSDVPGGDRVRFVFDGGVLSDVLLDSIVLPPQELRAWACVPEQELFAVLALDLTRRVTAALGARVAGEMWYLENSSRSTHCDDLHLTGRSGVATVPPARKSAFFVRPADTRGAGRRAGPVVRRRSAGWSVLREWS